MSDPSSTGQDVHGEGGALPPALEEEVRAVVERFLESLETGQALDRAALLQAHPAIAGVLARRLEAVEALHRTARRAGDAAPRGAEPGPLCCPHCGRTIAVPPADSRPVSCSECGGTFHVDRGPGRTAGAGCPEKIGRFDVVALLGRGAYGVVYKAIDPELDRLVALKVPRAGLFTPEDEERFRREARSAASLRHPAVVQVHEVFDVEGVPCLVSEFVEGRTLECALSERRMPFREAAEILVELAEGLDHAHRHKVIHRDVKPGNIIIDPAGRPHITDFGLARRDEAEVSVTLDGQVLGTPAYMSPEQARGDRERVDRRTDVYSLGAVLYELLTGERPFRGNRSTVIHQVIHDEPHRPRRLNRHVPKDLETICLKAMAKEPSRRYFTATELADDLRRYLRSEPVRARPVSAAERLWRWRRRNPVIAGLGATVVFLLVAVAVISSAMAVHTSNAYDAARRRLSRLHVATGFHHVDDGDAFGALAFFAEAWSQDSGDPAREEMHRLRFEATLLQCPILRNVWFFEDFVYRVTFSPDGRLLAAVAGDGCSLLDLSSGRSTPVGGRWTGPHRVGMPPFGYRASFHPGGGSLASTALDSKAWVSSSAGDLLLELPEGHGTVHQVCFSPDGRLLLTAGADGSVSLRDSGTCTPTLGPLKHGAPVLDACFSPDGEWIATACADGAVTTWSTRTGARSAVLRHRDQVYSVEFSHDGRRIATASADRTAGVWDRASGSRVSTLRHGAVVFVATFSPDDGRILTVSLDTTAVIWDPDSGAKLCEPIQHVLGVHHGCFSPDGRRVATACYDGTARLWDAWTGKPCGPPMVHGTAVACVAFSPDGRLLVTASLDSMVRLWDIAAMDPPRLPMEAPGGLEHASLAAGCGTLLMIGKDRTARVWDLETCDPASAPLRHDGHPWLGAVSMDGRRVVTVEADSIVLWDPDAASVLARSSYRGAITHVEFSPAGDLIAAASTEGRVHVWSAAALEPLFKPLEHTAWVNHVTFSPDGLTIVTSCFDGWARLWDARTGAPRTTPNLANVSPFRRGVRHARFSPDGKRVATAGVDEAARVWDAQSGRELVPPLWHKADVSYVEFSPDGRRLATACDDGTARVWDASSGEAITPFLHHSRPVAFASFSPDGKKLVTGGPALQARVWDASTGEPLTPFLGSSVKRAFFDRGGDRLVTLNGDGTADAWPLRPKPRPARDAVLLAQLLSGRRIDSTEGLARPEYREFMSEFRRLWEDYKRRYPVELPDGAVEPPPTQGR